MWKSITPQIHTRKFETLHFLGNISTIAMIQIFRRKEYRINFKGKLHNRIVSIVKFQGFQIFTCEFGEWYFSTWGNSRESLFLSTRWCISPITSGRRPRVDGEMHHQVLRKRLSRELPHVEKPFSSESINKLENSQQTYLSTYPSILIKILLRFHFKSV